MDWPVTNGYCRAFARHFRVPLFFTWKEGGFEREMNRQDARTAPIHFEAPVGDPRPGGPVEIKTTGGTGGTLSTRRAFPQVAADLSVRWCSAYLKIDNARTALRNQDRFAARRRTDADGARTWDGVHVPRTLFVSGERAEESAGRAGYARFEPDDADLRGGRHTRRHIDRWRPVHGWTEAEVWGRLEEWHVEPHPAYRLGWSRCSCAACIFNGADEFATLRAIDPARFARLAAYETEFGRTMKRDRSLAELADAGAVLPVLPEHVEAALSTTFARPIQAADWVRPVGAFRGGCGPS